MLAAVERARALADAEEDLRRLAARSPRLALLVEASSARRDVRRVRARILLLLLSLSCPLSGRPRRAWYVPGAVARMGPRALLRAWQSFWEEVPSEKTLRRHLAALESMTALVREPGARIAALRAPGRAPRYPDTLHVLEDELLGRWWEREGAEVLRREPALRSSPERWKARLGSWRQLARAGEQLELPFEAPARRGEVRRFPGYEEVPQDLDVQRAHARALGAKLEEGPLALLGELRRAGVHVPARRQAELVGAPGKLRKAAAAFGAALLRGDRIRNGWGWIRAALRTVSEAEASEAFGKLTGRWPRMPLGYMEAVP